MPFLYLSLDFSVFNKGTLMAPALQLLFDKSMNQKKKKKGNGSLMVLYFRVDEVIYYGEFIIS